MSLFLIMFLLIGCATRTEPSPTARMSEPLFRPYGVVYPYPASDWTEADRPGIRAHLTYLRELGVNTIVQVFSSRLIGTGRERDWLIVLDEAERANIRVVARLDSPTQWNGREFDLRAVQSFLAVVQNHPALLAYLGLHEPLEQFNSNQLRDFYSDVRDLAPEVAVAHYMGNIAWFEASLRFPKRDFTPGICDICIIWYYPARYVDGQPAFEEDRARQIMQTHRRLISERAPEAQLWFLGQTFAQSEHERTLRMPTPGEMERLYALAEREQVDGFLWYPWLHGSYDQVLGDPEMEPQRNAVRQIHEDRLPQERAMQRTVQVVAGQGTLPTDGRALLTRQ